MHFQFVLRIFQKISKIPTVNEAEREEWRQTREVLRQGLQKVEKQILAYSPDDSDEDFRFLITKATKFRDWIVEIDRMLNED